eukprot:TRINITY_DN363_c0_g1_i5.p1 TRINITY_DN363_c0_g1~~TRINITY_DN363_c0_g1_i5.p1  ORF type:complete len:786 (-),score=304.83 TRINITY_DN363_c0_g1_i5:285-2642(-)
MSGMALLNDSSSSEDENEDSFKINEDYATRYEQWRGKEVLQKLKDKHGDEGSENSGDDNEDESSEESEDSDAEELTEEIERDFYKTLASLKAKDPKIYDEKVRFFSEKTAKSEPKEKKDKKITLADMERTVMLEKGGVFDEVEDKSLKNKDDVTYTQEMRGIKESFKAALESEGESSEEEGEEEKEEKGSGRGGLLKKREKSQQEKNKEEDEYKSWLAGQTNSISDSKLEEDMSGLKNYWNKKDLDEEEKFLKDFLLNKRYKESDKDDFIPTYDQIVHDSDENLSEDEKKIAEQEEFEHKFNFRFEEPDEEFIKRYPRTIKDSMRQQSEKRKKKRKETEERKKAEKQQKKDELKMLKSLKKKEILEKLDRLKKITGNDEMAIRDEDIDGDFDAAEYDKRMKEIFENFDDSKVDTEKPSFSDIEDDEQYGEELEVENWDSWTGVQGEEGGEGYYYDQGEGGDTHCEDQDFNMDCDYNAEAAQMQKDLIENSRGRKKSRRKSKFSQALEQSQDKPVFDPKDKTFEEYVDEYYKLDCEDVIANIPCRFKYRQVAENDFGLSSDEILLADDRELNAWASLRKTCQYRSEEEEKKDKVVFNSKRKNFELKKKLLPSLFELPDEKEETSQKDLAAQETTNKKKKKKKKNKKRKLDEDTENTEERSHNQQQQQKKQKLDTVPEQEKPCDTPQANTVTTSTTPPNENKKKNKKNKNNKDNASSNQENKNSKPHQAFNHKKPHKKNNALKSKSKNVFTEKPQSAMSDDRLKAYGINPSKLSKLQRKEKYKNANK